MIIYFVNEIVMLSKMSFFFFFFKYVFNKLFYLDYLSPYGNVCLKK